MTKTIRDTIRAESLAAAVGLAEALHSDLVARHGTDAGDRAAAIVAVLDEAHAYWTTESHGGGCRTEGDAQAIAAGLAAHLTDRAPELVWNLLPAGVRRAAVEAVIADMRAVVNVLAPKVRGKGLPIFEWGQEITPTAAEMRQVAQELITAIDQTR